MRAPGSALDWAPMVIDFLSNNLPKDCDNGGWNDMASTAYQIGCEALAALGYAKVTDRGAIPLANPALPNSFPRWDDICVAVLWLAEQQNKLSYRLADGSRQPSRPDASGLTIRLSGEQHHLPAPNVASNGKMGPAYVHCDLLPVLLKLGLIKDGHWADRAEMVLWREQPDAWALDISIDPRFLVAVQDAVDTLPCDIRKEIDGLVLVSDEDIGIPIARNQTDMEKLLATLKPDARIRQLTAPEEIRCGLVFQRRSELDSIFFRRWRLSDGWLTIEQAKLALEIFHDPLAIQMRCAVLGHLHPEYPEFSG